MLAKYTYAGRHRQAGQQGFFAEVFEMLINALTPAYLRA